MVCLFRCCDEGLRGYANLVPTGSGAHANAPNTIQHGADPGGWRQERANAATQALVPNSSINELIALHDRRISEFPHPRDAPPGWVEAWRQSRGIAQRHDSSGRPCRTCQPRTSRPTRTGRWSLCSGTVPTNGCCTAVCRSKIDQGMQRPGCFFSEGTSRWPP